MRRNDEAALERMPTPLIANVRIVTEVTFLSGRPI
jgi:hypothetical protein